MLSKCFIIASAFLFAYSPLKSASDFLPWGKDADLVKTEKPKSQEKEPAGFEAIIFFHQKVISEADGPRSHYYPSSSQYMLVATRKYGFFKGFTMGCDRLMRENSEKWIYPLKKTRDGDWLKLDPVP